MGDLLVCKVATTAVRLLALISSREELISQWPSTSFQILSLFSSVPTSHKYRR